MKPSILVVDDDASVRESIKNILEQSGYRVILAGDGEEGAARLKSGKFNLAFLDLDLPKRCGFELLDLVRAKDPAPAVIVLSGMLRHCEPGSLEGADAIFEKPPDVSELLNAVEFLLTETPEARVRRREACCLAGTGQVGGLEKDCFISQLGGASARLKKHYAAD